MAANETEKRAQSVYRTLCQALDDRKWVYQKDEENNRVRVTVTGEDLPMTLNITVDAPDELVKIHSTLFKISEERRVEAALVICAINYRLVDGCFDYDLRDGEVAFADWFTLGSILPADHNYTTLYVAVRVEGEGTLDIQLDTYHENDSSFKYAVNDVAAAETEGWKIVEVPIAPENHISESQREIDTKIVRIIASEGISAVHLDWIAAKQTKVRISLVGEADGVVTVPFTGNIILADIDSIAIMKMELALTRGKYRDYYDLYCIFKDRQDIVPMAAETSRYTGHTIKSKFILSTLTNRERFAKDMRFQQLNPKYDVDAVQIEQFFRTEIASELESSMKKK